MPQILYHAKVTAPTRRAGAAASVAGAPNDLRHHDLDTTWKAIAKKVKMAKPKKLGRCITTQEQAVLLDECRQSRSRSLTAIVVMAIESCLRSSEIRFLRWRNLDFGRRVITVGESKTDAGEGREVPMSRALFFTLTAWASNFPARKLDHFVFPSEKYGQKKKATKPPSTLSMSRRQSARGRKHGKRPRSAPGSPLAFTT